MEWPCLSAQLTGSWLPQQRQQSSGSLHWPVWPPSPKIQTWRRSLPLGSPECQCSPSCTHQCRGQRWCWRTKFHCSLHGTWKPSRALLTFSYVLPGCHLPWQCWKHDFCVSPISSAVSLTLAALELFCIMFATASGKLFIAVFHILFFITNTAPSLQYCKPGFIADFYDLILFSLFLIRRVTKKKQIMFCTDFPG